jgi:hypothetical protein
MNRLYGSRKSRESTIPLLFSCPNIVWKGES